MITKKNILGRPGIRSHLLIKDIPTLLLVIASVVFLGLASCTLVRDVPSPSPKVQSAPPPSSAAKPPSAIVRSQNLQELLLREDRGQTILFVKFVQPVTQYRHFMLPQPSRIVLDILDEEKTIIAGDTYRVDTNWVSTLRISANEGSPL